MSGAETLEWWARRFRELGVEHGAVSERDGRAVLDFEDPEGQRFRLTADGANTGQPWEKSPVPAEHQILGELYGLGAVDMKAGLVALLRCKLMERARSPGETGASWRLTGPAGRPGDTCILSESPD